MYHLPPLIPPSGGFGIELHTSLGLEHLESLLPPASIMERAVGFEWRERSILIPHPTDSLIHNIAHSQIHHDLFSRNTTELRQIRELALLAVRNCHHVDWTEVERRFSAAGYAEVLASQAALSETLMGITLPIGKSSLEKAMKRLRHGVLNNDPDTNGRLDRTIALGRLAKVYLVGFWRDPRLAVNLVNPFWWPNRIRGMSKFLHDASSGGFHPPDLEH